MKKITMGGYMDIPVDQVISMSAMNRLYVMILDVPAGQVFTVYPGVSKALLEVDGYQDYSAPVMQVGYLWLTTTVVFIELEGPDLTPLPPTAASPTTPISTGIWPPSLVWPRIPLASPTANPTPPKPVTIKCPSHFGDVELYTDDISGSKYTVLACGCKVLSDVVLERFRLASKKI